MRVAFVGKGGSGKSAVAGTFVRVLAATGHAVLAIDSDPMPGLAWSIGIPPTDAGLPDDILVEGEEGGPRFRLRDGLTADAAVEGHALRGPDGIRFLQFGKLRGRPADQGRSQQTFLAITRELDDTHWHLVGDLPAGTRQAYSGWARYADTLLVVVEPTAKSVLSARRLARMADATNRSDDAHIPRMFGVANKVTSPSDTAELQSRTGLEFIASIPFDPAFSAAERRAKAPIDAVPDSPAVAGVESLMDALQHSSPQRPPADKDHRS